MKLRDTIPRGPIMKLLDVIAAVILVVGGLNWGLVGFFNVDLVASLFGAGAILTRIIYCMVGLCALYDAIFVRSIQKRWGVHMREQMATT